MDFELSWGDIFIVFFLTLGPLKAILPFARATHGTDLGFQRRMAWQSTPQTSPSPPSPAIAVFPLAMPAILTAPGITAIAAILLNKHDLAHEAIVIVILLGVMVLNLLTLWDNETILKHGLAGILPVIGWVLAVLQAALAVQIIMHALRVLEVMHWPAS